MHCQLGVERRIFGQIANALLHPLRVTEHVNAIHMHRTFVGLNITSERLYNCRFASTIWPQQTNDFALLDAKTNII